jgi:ribose/xylose/arabinose/galactoside ABC-type transport system permease subunit
MHIDRIPFWVPLLIALAVAALALAWRRGWLKLPLTQHELAVTLKILFIVGSIMMLVTLRNAIELPAGQFIYGRF